MYAADHCLACPLRLAPLLQGQDIFGRYMQDVLQAERVRTVEPVAAQQLSPEQDHTLLCFVLVAPGGKHAFCRRGRGWGGG